jgi:hypothetical protein
MFTGPLPRNGLHKTGFLLLRVCMLRALPSNGRYLQSHRVAMGLYAAIFLHHFRTATVVLI